MIHTTIYDPDEIFSIAAHQLALTFMRTKFGRVSRSIVYADRTDIGPAINDDHAIKVTVELVDKSEMDDASKV